MLNGKSFLPVLNGSNSDTEPSRDSGALSHKHKSSHSHTAHAALNFKETQLAFQSKPSSGSTLVQEPLLTLDVQKHDPFPYSVIPETSNHNTIPLDYRYITSDNIKDLKRLNQVLFPINYNERFYQHLVEINPPELSRIGGNSFSVFWGE